MTKRALITGVTGQDGYYLSELLVTQGYDVFGQTRSACNFIHGLAAKPISFDLRSQDAWRNTIEEYQLDEIYHLAGVSSVPMSWTAPSETLEANVGVTVSILDAMRSVKRSPRLFFASSSEVFGQPIGSPQNEETPFRPLNPYGVTKAASFGMIESYRKQYCLFACSGILFNHESPRRDPTFVTRKITKAVVAIRMGIQDRLVLGNLDVARDWGYAGDYVSCMHKMLQADSAQDYVIGTGRLATLERVVEKAFQLVDLNWKDYVSVDPNLIRSNDAKTRVADCSKALHHLGWKATTTIAYVIEMMVEHDLRLVQKAQRRVA